MNKEIYFIEIVDRIIVLNIIEKMVVMNGLNECFFCIVWDKFFLVVIFNVNKIYSV